MFVPTPKRPLGTCSITVTYILAQYSMACLCQETHSSPRVHPMLLLQVVLVVHTNVGIYIMYLFAPPDSGGPLNAGARGMNAAPSRRGARLSSSPASPAPLEIALQRVHGGY